MVVDRLTNIRFKALSTGLSKRELAAANKLPISTRLATMSFEKRICFFNPMILTGKIFHAEEKLLQAAEDGHPEALAELKRQLLGFSETSRDQHIIDLMKSFLHTI